jgi:hypothetical protein
VLFLDVDGVLNRTAYRPATSEGLRSWIEPELARRLCEVIRSTGVEIVLSSDWRCGRELDVLRVELHAAGIVGTLKGVTPVLDRQERWREIDAWLRANEVGLERVAIVDDGFDMGPLAPRFVRTSPLAGLDESAARAIVALFE